MTNNQPEYNVDTTKTTTHIGLCAGYGGIELGLKRVIPNLRSVALCEIEAFACANLVAKMEAGLMDPAPIWSDLKTFPWAEFCGKVDILTGGYPCQPFSAAGKRAGKDDPRHLWPWIADGIRLLQPRMCFFENVEGHISLGLSTVISDLEEMGYRTTWGIFSASEVGAPHQRKRVFILAYANSNGDSRSRHFMGKVAKIRQGWKASTKNCELLNQWVADTNDCGGGQDQLLPELRSTRIKQPPGCPRLLCGSPEVGEVTAWPSRPGQPQHDWEPPRVVVDAKSQRTGQRSELRSEECGSGSALPRDIEQSSEGAVANDHRPHAGHGEERPERTHRDLSGGCGEAMGNATSERPRTLGAEPAGQQRQASITSTGDAMGNANSPRPQERTGQRGAGIQGTHADGGADAERQTQPALGRDADGSAHRLDDAELYVTCDNRTDELRLLGNGVVPATAERALRVLMNQTIV